MPNEQELENPETLKKKEALGSRIAKTAKKALNFKAHASPDVDADGSESGRKRGIMNPCTINSLP